MTLPGVLLRGKLPGLTTPDLIFAFFMLAVGAATLKPVWHGGLETMVRALQGVLGFSLVAVVYMSVQLIDPRGEHVRDAMKSFIFGNLASAIYGIYQVICDLTGRRPIVLLHNTPNYALAAHTGARYFRAYGFSPEPSLMVGPLVVALVFLLTAFYPSFARSRLGKSARWAAVVILALALLLTSSQTLFLVPVTFLVLMLAAPRSLRTRLKGMARIAAIILLCTAGIIYVSQFEPLLFIVRHPFVLLTGVPQNTARLSTILAAFRVFAQDPVFGVGPGIATGLVAEFGAERLNVIDSLAVRILADTGLVGFTAWALFILAVVTMPVKYSRSEPEFDRKLILVGVSIGSMAGFVWQSVTTSAITFYYPWFWSAYAAAVLRRRLAPNEIRRRKVQPKALPQRDHAQFARR